MLPRTALLGAAFIAAAAFVYKQWGFAWLLQEESEVIAQLQQYPHASEPVVVWLGRAFFFIAATAWVVLGIQSVAAAIERACYKPVVQQALQPMTEQSRLQQQQAQQLSASSDNTGSSTAAKAATAAAAAAQEAALTLRQSQRQAAAAAQQAASDAAAATVTAAAATSSANASRAAAAAQEQRQQQELSRDERRLRALEAAQRALDEQAAARREQQEKDAAERRARKAKAAEEAARKKAAQEAELEARQAAAAAAAAEDARRRELWAQAVRDQWRGLTPPTAPESDEQGAPNAAAAPPAGGAAAAVAEAAAARQLREQQDREYQQSLERDRIQSAKQEAHKAAAAAAEAAKSQREKLAGLRLSLQQQLPPEPKQQTADNTGSSSSLETLMLRVRLPDGSNASRRFRANQGFEDVFAWVFSLAAMPLWAPGSWNLVSAFPRKQLAPPSSSIWAAGGWQRQQPAAEAASAASDDDAAMPPGHWLLQVKQMVGEPLHVRVNGGSNIGDIKAAIQGQTGLAPEQQRLIFGGRFLQQDSKTLHQLGVDSSCTLQLAPRTSGSTGGGSDASVGGAGSPRDAPAVVVAAAEAASTQGPRVDEFAQSLSQAAEHAYLGDGEVLVVHTVAELQEKVAAGASLLALYVEANQQSAEETTE